MKKNTKVSAIGKKKVVKISASPIKKEGRLGSFPIIGIGASAGGLEAFEEFFRHMAPDSGMAFVLIPHLDPVHASMLTEILQRATVMPVTEALDQIEVETNHVYIIPPNREMAVFHGTLQLSAPKEPRGLRLPIDLFLRSLADDQAQRAICVILSGTGTDGTLGLRAIHGAGGVSFVQDPATAKYDGMPNSAVRSGMATYVLPVEKIPEQLTAYVKTLFEKKIKPPLSAPVAANAINKIMLLLRSKTGHDFSLYKKNTIDRRIERRITAHNIEDKDAYVRYLQENPDEIHLLFKELLINVTSFFRDPEAFAALKSDTFPGLFQDKPEDYIFRIWVPGCATGEEAYSIAIILREYMDEIKQEFKIQIYATDINEEAIAQARTAIYLANISADLTPERLRRFFVSEGAGYRVKKDIREMVVFATQSVIKDPPFTRLDLLSCRNLLIYLEPELQERLIPTFQYALKSGGVLFLGPSESVGKSQDLFNTVNRKWKVFKIKQNVPSVRVIMPKQPAQITKEAGTYPAVPKKAAREAGFTERTTKVLFQSYVPPSVITNEKGDIFYLYGDTGKYLQPALGQPTLNVIEMAREGLQSELRFALHRAAAKKTRVICKDLRVKTSGGVHSLDLVIRPVADPKAAEGMFVITFQDVPVEKKDKPVRSKRWAGQNASKRIKELERELLRAKDNLRASVEEQQAFNEELKSTNEELQSTNEELQSTNEELETSKEELQSVNEELVTVNAELQAKIEQLVSMQNDMKNLLESTGMGVIFLDTNLAIKQFTHEATTISHLIATDIGRPLSDIKLSILGEDLVSEAQAVLETLVPREKVVETSGHAWYLVRLLPYRTLENVIDGVVLTFVDITERKKVEDIANVMRSYAENIVDTVREPLIVLDNELKVVTASKSFYKMFRVNSQNTIGNYIYELGNQQWNIPRLRELLETILPRDTSFEDVEVEHEFPEIGHKKMLLNARRIAGNAGETRFILLAMEEITNR